MPFILQDSSYRLVQHGNIPRKVPPEFLQTTKHQQAFSGRRSTLDTHPVKKKPMTDCRIEKAFVKLTDEAPNSSSFPAVSESLMSNHPFSYTMSVNGGWKMQDGSRKEEKTNEKYKPYNTGAAYHSLSSHPSFGARGVVIEKVLATKQGVLRCRFRHDGH